MEARLEIAGLDEIIKEAVKQELKKAVREVIEPILREFKTEIIATSKDELLKLNVWDKKDIASFVGRSKSWVDKKFVANKEFPKKLYNNGKAVWKREDILNFIRKYYPQFL